MLLVHFWQTSSLRHRKSRRPSSTALRSFWVYSSPANIEPSPSQEPEIIEHRPERGRPGILIATPYYPPPGGAGKKIIPFSFLCMICVTIVPKRHTFTSRQKSINVTSHHILRATYYSWYCFRLLLGCTLQGRVVIRHTYNAYMYSQFSVVLPLHGSARHSVIQ